jgi:hypothetical protein
MLRVMLLLLQQVFMMAPISLILVKGATIPAGGSLIVVGGDQKDCS